MEFPITYKNGNTKVILLKDGTKIRFYEEPVYLKHPESIDIKITNKCDLECPYCHENSVKDGLEGNLEWLLTYLNGLSKGVELAIGGGNPLSHRDLLDFLKECRNKGLICNITINQKHVRPYRDLIYALIRNELIYGIGISVNSLSYVDDIKLVANLTDNLVLHIIAGIVKYETIMNLYNELNSKILILGYKDYGRGIRYHNDTIDKNINELKANMSYIVNSIPIAFDNLALEQLNVKDYVSEDIWEMYYMGDDGDYTMYVDAINKEYAISSTSNKRIKIKENETILDNWKDIQLTKN